jgi:hypothetical protein
MTATDVKRLCHSVLIDFAFHFQNPHGGLNEDRLVRDQRLCIAVLFQMLLL